MNKTVSGMLFGATLTLMCATLSVMAAEDLYYYDQLDQKVSLTAYDKPDAAPGVRYYLTENAELLAVRGLIVVKFAVGSEDSALLNAHAARTVHTMADGTRLVEISDADKTLETANALHVDPGVLYAFPDFMFEVRSR